MIGFKVNFILCNHQSLLSNKCKEEINIYLLPTSITELKSIDRFQSEFHHVMQSVEFNFTLLATGIRMKTGELGES